jgi:GT2 family glycosyltransferase
MLNYNALEMTKMCVSSLFKNTDYPFNLILVDNASSEPGTKEFLDSLVKEHKNVIVHVNEVPDSGFAEGNNIGLSYSTNELVLLANNDLLFFRKDWLRKLVEVMAKDEKIALVAPKLIYPNDTIQHAGTYIVPSFILNKPENTIVWEHIGRFQDRMKYSFTREIGGVTFACVLARKSILGKLDESYKIGTYEDNQKCVEILEKGYKIVYCGESEVYHYESYTQLRRPREQFEPQRIENYKLFNTRKGEVLRRMWEENPKLFGYYDPDIKISAIVLAKDCERTIPYCLESLKFFDEIIVGYTKSSDKTYEKIKSTNARIVEIEEIEDFSKTREDLGKEASNEYLFYLDSDEIIHPSVYFELNRHFSYSKTNATFPRVNISIMNLAYANKYPDFQTRATCKATMKWVGKIHERLLEVGEIIPYGIVHFGNCLETWNLKKWRYISDKKKRLGYYGEMEEKNLSNEENFRRIVEAYSAYPQQPIDIFRNEVILPKKEKILEIVGR